MLSRPFTTHCHSTPLSGGGNLQVFVEFKPEYVLTDDRLARLRLPFQGLAHMGQWGGLAGDLYEPQRSRVTLVTDGKPQGASTVRWDYNVTNVHPGTPFIIQNIVHILHRFVAPVHHLVLRSPLLGDGTPLVEELPLDYEPYPFIVNCESGDLTVRVDADFVVRQAPHAAEPFREAWDGWCDVATYGGFCNEDYPPEKLKILGASNLEVASTGIGGLLEDVLFDDAGFYCLINMLQVLHHRLTPISEVTIE